MTLLLYLLIGLSLSMDAFSLALIYGAGGLKKKLIPPLSILVGVFHFFMPIIGSMIGKYYILHYVHNANIIVGIVLLVIASQMIISSQKEECGTMVNNKFTLFLFPLTVSLDSFSVGIALGLSEDHIIIAGIIFAILASLMTFIGLILGKKINEKYGKRSCVIGGVILIALALRYIFM